MSHEDSDNWDPQFHGRSPLFAPLASMVAQHFSQLRDWPGLADFNRVFTEQPVMNAQGLNIHCVSQAAKSSSFAEAYEPRIYHQGELQTRLANWHDFFNFLVWQHFPKTKALLNAKQVQALSYRHQNAISERSIAEHVLTMFDECGAIFVSSDADQLDLLKDFGWWQLFWHNRKRFAVDTAAFIFGHGIFEKAINPYVGLTAKAVLLRVDQDFFQTDSRQQLAYLDVRLVAHFQQAEAVAHTKVLQPLPILGIPGWYPENEDELFYRNTDYFRVRTC
ncbi:MAG: hypothetical protein CMF50_08940 [Legionellales bacterium]|nr:hypothetical protein [Legionellales bacterium]|tara:strand:- start:21159 stop:21989 length:831 start_codon:yes stop_codon:yes gene_type:complete